MSYDLFFYKQKGSLLAEQDIRDYLANNLTKPNERNNQWWFENEDTGVYFCFETTDESDFENYNEIFERFTGFENTRFMFNINFIRPDFFGKEAFSFVEKFVQNLDLYVLNPQSEFNPDNPYKPNKNELYENWASTNETATAEHFGEGDFYYPEDETNAIWRHNYNKWNLQAQYKEMYYVPRIYLVKEYKTGQTVTLTSWTEHIPNIFPPADYIFILRKKKKFFKSVIEHGYISYKTLVEKFGHLLDDIDIEGYKIIHPENAEKAAYLFNSLKFDIEDKQLGEVVSWDKVFNAKP